MATHDKSAKKAARPADAPEPRRRTRSESNAELLATSAAGSRAASPAPPALADDGAARKRKRATSIASAGSDAAEADAARLKAEKKARKEAKAAKAAAAGGDDADAKAEKKKAKKAKLDAAAAAAEPAAAAPAAPPKDANPPVASFDIRPATAKALAARGVTALFPIQAQSFTALRSGKDVIGRARTGQGKTLAFAIPTVERLLDDKERGGVVGSGRGRAPRALVLAPTRELAKQIADDFAAIAPGLATLTVYGGVGFEVQRGALSRGVDIVVGTPGRILDLLNGGSLRLGDVVMAVLDEADRMLDMGFADDVQKIFDAVPGMAIKAAAASGSGAGAGSSSSSAAAGASSGLQTVLFSATLPGWVKDLARKYMSRPLTIDLVEASDAKASVDVAHLVLQCPWQVRPGVIGDLVRLYCGAAGKAVVFVETKKEADELAVNPALSAHVEVKALHGDVPQAQREATLAAFKKGALRCLCATDVAARGLDIKGVDLVIQTQPPAGAC
jgi:ATP-dependent RNA helicase DDX21